MPAIRLRNSSAAAARGRISRPALIGVAMLLWAALPALSGARAAEPAAHGTGHGTGAVVLSPAQLDNVTAGGVLARIDLTADARGAAAFTDTSLALHSLRGTVLKVDPRPAASPRLLGTQRVDVTYGTGKATAAGDQGADCSAKATLLATDLVAGMVAAAKQATTTTALCQCSLMGVSLVK